MGVASGCGEQEVGVASGSGWNLWVWLLGVVVRRYIDFLILLIPTPLVSVLFYSSILLFVHFFKMFFVLVYIVVTDFRLHHTCSIIIILLWLHSLSGVIRSLLCNPRAFRQGIAFTQGIIIFRISVRRRSCGIPRAHVRKYGNMYMYDCHGT